MAISNKISLETRFQINTTTPNFKITDNTDYASESIATSDVIGVLKIVSPLGGVIHETTLPLFDIDLDVQDYIDTIVLPLDSNNDVLSGTYTITYTIRVSGAVQPGDYSQNFTYKYCYVKPTPNIDIEIDLLCSKLTSTDNTSYPVEMTNNTLTHTIFPPNGLSDVDYPDKVVSTEVNTYTPITTKTWTSKISNIIEITYADGLIVDDTIIGDSEKDVKDDINICNLQCNMRALVERYNQASKYNSVNADSIYREQLAPALANAFMYTSNIQCGNFAKAESYYNEVLKFTGSQPDCSCEDSSTPTLITPSCGTGGGGTFMVDACGANNAITVTSNTVGSTTTYTVCFNNTLFNKVSALTETAITSSDSSITVSSSTVGYTKTYDIKVPKPTISIFSGIMDIDLSVKSVVPVIRFRSSWSSVFGDKLKEPTLIVTDNVFANFQVKNNSFYIEDYINSGGGEYPKPIIQNVDITYVKEGSRVDSIEQIKPSIYFIDTTNNRIYFRFIDSKGFPVTGQWLLERINSISATIIINA